MKTPTLSINRFETDLFVAAVEIRFRSPLAAELRQGCQSGGGKIK